MRFKCFLPTKQTTVDLDVDDSMVPADIRERLLTSVGIPQKERKNYDVSFKAGFPPADITLDEEDGGTVSPLMARKGDAITANITIAQHLTKANESKVHSRTSRQAKLDAKPKVSLCVKADKKKAKEEKEIEKKGGLEPR